MILIQSDFFPISLVCVFYYFKIALALELFNDSNFLYIFLLDEKSNETFLHLKLREISSRAERKLKKGFFSMSLHRIHVAIKLNRKCVKWNSTKNWTRKHRRENEKSMWTERNGTWRREWVWKVDVASWCFILFVQQKLKGECWCLQKSV